VTLQECIHHWKIEDANGPLSTGVCQLCGEVRDFHNSDPGSGNWSETGVRTTQYWQPFRDDQNAHVVAGG